MRTSEKIDEIATAMQGLQSKLKPVKRNASNPEFGSKYADLPTVKESVRIVLFRYGLSVVQFASSHMPPEGFWQATVTTRVMHCSGQWIEGEPLTFPSMAATPHGMASALTFARRYAFCAALGIVAESEDDDGNTASGRGGRKRAKQPEAEAVMSPVIDAPF